MQKIFAGTNPNCAVLKAITHTTMLLAPAINHPCQSFLPTKMAETTVRTQEM